MNRRAFFRMTVGLFMTQRIFSSVRVLAGAEVALSHRKYFFEWPRKNGKTHFLMTVHEGKMTAITPKDIERFREWLREPVL